MAISDLQQRDENTVQESAVFFTRFYRFAEEWQRSNTLLLVGPVGGADYFRVLRLWHKAGYPNNVAAFIAANENS